jgi:hypothetical protein
MPSGRTSTPELPANGLLAALPACSGRRQTILVDGAMNANSATKPGMIPIKNLAKNGPVGVLKPRCTTASELIDP